MCSNSFLKHNKTQIHNETRGVVMKQDKWLTVFNYSSFSLDTKETLLFGVSLQQRNSLILERSDSKWN